jgi:hypothetical protein
MKNWLSGKKLHKSMKIKVVGGAADEQENINVLEIDFRNAIEMIRSGEKKDGNTIMLLQYAQINNLL